MLGLVILVDLGVMPATNVAIVPYLVAIVYLSTFVQYSDFVTFSHIPQALHFHRLSKQSVTRFDEIIILKE